MTKSFMVWTNDVRPCFRSIWTFIAPVTSLSFNSSNSTTDRVQFINAYYENIGKQNIEAIENHPLGQAMAKFYDEEIEGNGLWEGSPTELLGHIEIIAQNNGINTNQKSWPKEVRWEKYEEAIKCYDEAIKIKPDYANAWFNRACSNVRKGEIENALSDLEKAIRTGGEKYIGYARDEEDFKDISKDPRFIRLLSGENTDS